MCNFRICKIPSRVSLANFWHFKIERQIAFGQFSTTALKLSKFILFQSKGIGSPHSFVNGKAVQNSLTAKWECSQIIRHVIFHFRIQWLDFCLLQDRNKFVGKFMMHFASDKARVDVTELSSLDKGVPKVPLLLEHWKQPSVVLMTNTQSRFSYLFLDGVMLTAQKPIHGSNTQTREFLGLCCLKGLGWIFFTYLT